MPEICVFQLKPISKVVLLCEMIGDGHHGRNVHQSKAESRHDAGKERVCKTSVATICFYFKIKKKFDSINEFV